MAVAWALLVVFFCALAHASVRLDSAWRRKLHLSPFLAIVHDRRRRRLRARRLVVRRPRRRDRTRPGTAAFAYVCEACGALLLALARAAPAPPGGFCRRAPRRRVRSRASDARLAPQRPLRRVGLVALERPPSRRPQRRRGLHLGAADAG